MELIKYKGYQVPVRDEEAGDVPMAFDVIPKSPSGELLQRVLVEREREATR
jgi:acyl-CoA synthetase (AMP-forming)/AMP-acid ligase II